MQDLDQILKTLAEKAKNGDDEAFERILKLLDVDMKKLAGKYYIVGSDSNDVVQECRIGIWKAIKDFNPDAGMSFKNFSLNLCVKRHLITAMSHANTQKFKLQNEAVSLSTPVSQNEDDGIQTYADYIPDKDSDVLEGYIAKEEFDTNLEMISGQLTKLEMHIFDQFTYNSSYKDIASALDIKAKAVDNALMRIRKKGREVYKDYQESVAYSVSSSAIAMNSISFTHLVGIGTAF